MIFDMKFSDFKINLGHEFIKIINLVEIPVNQIIR